MLKPKNKPLYLQIERCSRQSGNATARLGDGFYEQRLIREQIGQLTGYASDEAQYQALMMSGVTFAQAHQLVPGVALSAAQVAQLTSDIVWLVEQTVNQSRLTPLIVIQMIKSILAIPDLSKGPLISPHTLPAGYIVAPPRYTAPYTETP